jgi:hypothetical protein
LLRHFQRPGEGFFRFYHSPADPALAVLLNANYSQGATQVLFAVNPTLGDLTLTLDAAVAAPATAPWLMLADQDRFYPAGSAGARRPVAAQLWLPPLACGLWIREG